MDLDSPDEDEQARPLPTGSRRSVLGAMAAAIGGGVILPGFEARVSPADIGPSPATPSGPAKLAVASNGAGQSLSSDGQALQRAIDATRARSGRLHLPASATAYSSKSTLTLDMNSDLHNGFVLEGDAWSSNSAIGSTIRSTAAGAALRLPGSESIGNQNGSIEFRDFALIGAGPDVSAGAHGIEGTLVNYTLFRNLRVGGHGGDGYRLDRSFASAIERGLVYGNQGCGIRYLDAANRVLIRGVLAFANGRSTKTAEQANICLTSREQNPSMSPLIDNVDVSYSGRTLFAFTEGDDQIGRIEVFEIADGFARVQTSVPHGLRSGDMISTSIGTLRDLDTIGPVRISVLGPRAFTYKTGAVARLVTSRSDPGLRIGTCSHGLMLAGVKSGVIRNIYCENPSALAIWVAASCEQLLFEGGYILNGWMRIEPGARNISVRGMRFAGCGLITAEATDRAEIDVASSCGFVSGAEWRHGPYFMRDGIRYGPAPPRSGQWRVGEVLRNSAPSPQNPVLEWVCIATGEPGVFRPGASFS